MQIGIPRALSYYDFFPFWYGFFDALGIKVILSDPTTKQTMTTGSALVVPETCLPVKVYVGHVLNLLEKGIDKILVPSIQSIAPKIYNCSKLRGLPDLIRNVIKKPFTMVEATFDKSEKNCGLYSFLKEIAGYFNITDMEIIKKASKNAWKVYNNFHIMTRSGVSYKQALNAALKDKVIIADNSKTYPINVAVIAHGYNLYDERISMKIFDKLENLDVKAYSALNLTQEQMQEGLSKIKQNLYWANEYEINGAAAHYIQDKKIDGVITINAFGCGPDSLMIERISKFARDNKKPLLTLSIDEQTGEAGFVTRIEAFVDMLYRKKRANIINKIQINENITSKSECKDLI